MKTELQKQFEKETPTILKCGISVNEYNLTFLSWFHTKYEQLQKENEELKQEQRRTYLQGVKDGSEDYSEQPWTDSNIRDMMDELDELNNKK